MPSSPPLSQAPRLDTPLPDAAAGATLWLDLGQALVIAMLLVSALFLIAGFLILPAAPLA